jgi:hypothetical protein
MATTSSYELLNQAISDDHKLQTTKPTERPWQPGILRQLPWTGLLALTLGFGCGGAALTVALVSEGKPVDYWDVYGYSVQPTVLLAILVTFANALLGYAFASGIAIFWWSSALAGNTMRQLHASQSRGDSLMAVLTLRPIFNAVTIASIFTGLLLVDQPFFQRGIRVVSRSSQELRSMKIPVSSSPLQKGATGVLSEMLEEKDSRPGLFHPSYAPVVRQYQNRDPINLALPECKGRCDFDVVSTGWEVDCVEWETSYRMMGYSEYYTSLFNKTDYLDHPTPYDGPLEEQPAFSVNITYSAAYVHGPPWDAVRVPVQIETSVMYKATAGANGTMRWRNCTLIEALVKYPVEASNNTLRLQPMAPGTNRTTQRILREEEWSYLFYGAYSPPLFGRNC